MKDLSKDNPSIFQKPFWVAFFALTAAFVWGCAYPLIKLGFLAFQITPAMTGSKILFAGVRFSCAGGIILALAKFTKCNFSVGKPQNWGFVILYAIISTALHYLAFYLGLSHSAGARAAILNSLSVFLVVILACVFLKSDRFTFRKVLGCVLGFLGILILNNGNQTTGGFTWLGDGMIILNACCSAVASIMTRRLSKMVNIFVGTGYNLVIGGILLIGLGFSLGGYLPVLSKSGFLILVGLISISIIGFALYNKLISCNPMGKVAIFNSLIPVIGATTSCLFLHEPFCWKYAIAGVLAAVGIYTINKEK